MSRTRKSLHDMLLLQSPNSNRRAFRESCPLRCTEIRPSQAVVQQRLMMGVFCLSQSLRQTMGQTTPKTHPSGLSFPFLGVVFNIGQIPVVFIILIPLAGRCADALLKENYATSLPQPPSSPSPARKLICSILRWLSSRRKWRYSLMISESRCPSHSNDSASLAPLRYASEQK